MNALTAHIEQARYFLTQMLDNGFLTLREAGRELEHLSGQAQNLGLAKGREILAALAEETRAFGAGAALSGLTLRWANAVSYYEILLKMLTARSIVTEA